jgi:hypothetical protein
MAAAPLDELRRPLARCRAFAAHLGLPSGDPAPWSGVVHAGAAISATAKATLAVPSMASEAPWQPLLVGDNETDGLPMPLSVSQPAQARHRSFSRICRLPSQSLSFVQPPRQADFPLPRPPGAFPLDLDADPAHHFPGPPPGRLEKFLPFAATPNRESLPQRGVFRPAGPA